MNGAFIGFGVSRDTKQKLQNLNVPPSLEPLLALHCTVLYLGKTDAIEPHIRLEITKVCAQVCAGFSSFKARVSGFGVFMNGESSVIHAIVDSPTLCSLHVMLKDRLQRVLPVDNGGYGFNPHITLSYVDTRGVVFPVNTVENPVSFDSWVVDSLFIMFADTKVRIPLAPSGVAKSLIALGPTISLYKSRRKGSRNKHHMYLMRLTMPDGTYRYVRPDAEQVESYDAKTGFVFKNNVSTRDVINQKLFGSYGVVRKKDKSGVETDHEFIVPGMLYDYEARRTTPKYLKQYGVPVTEETVGKVRFYKYKRTPGFISYDLAPGVVYDMPKKGLDLILNADEAEKARRAMHPAEEGASPMSPHDFEATVIDRPDSPSTSDANPLHTYNIHAVKKQSDKTNIVLKEPLPQTVDPLVYGTSLGDNVRAKVESLPAYAIDKFDGEQNLLDELQKRPATVMVTLGLYDPAQTKTQKRLEEEWAPIIRGLARQAFDAYRVGTFYNNLKIRDTVNGHAELGKNSLTRQYRNDCMRDLTQQGLLMLYEAAEAYIPTQNADDRFDQFAYSEIKNELYAQSLKDVQNTGGSIERIASDAEADTLLHRQGMGFTQIELSPEEMADLTSTQREAKKVISTFLNSRKFPDTYRKVFLSRLWLDDEDVEAAKIQHRQDIGQKDVKNFERPYTGPDSIAQKYKKLTDPKTGKVINLEKLSPQAATYYLSKWYGEAQELLVNQVSRPIPATDEDDAVEKRTLTNAGKALKRWLTLKTALLSSNKRLPPVSRTQHPVLTMDLKKPYVATERQVVIPPTSGTTEGAAPSVLFWQHNKVLADKLGIKLPTDSLGVYTTPNVSVGTSLSHTLQTAEKYHKHAMALSTKSDKVLDKHATDSRNDLRAYRKIGVDLDSNGSIGMRSSGLLHDFHEAMVKHTGLSKRMSEKMAQGNAAMASLKERGHLVHVNTVNPFSQKKDPIAHAAHNSIMGLTTHAQVDASLADHLQSNYTFKNKKVFAQTSTALKNHLISSGSIKPVVTDKEIESLRTQYMISPKEETELQNAKERAASAGSLLANSHPVGRQIVQTYLEHAARDGVSQDLMNTTSNLLQNKAREAHNLSILVEHERERRKVTKSDNTASSLFKCFALHTYITHSLRPRPVLHV